MIDKKRRNFSKFLGGSVAVIPLVALSNRVLADDELPMVDPEAPTAKGLQYIEIAKDDRVNCASCSLYGDDGSGKKGKCTIFPGSLVPAEAWCAAYQPKA